MKMAIRLLMIMLLSTFFSCSQEQGLSEVSIDSAFEESVNIDDVEVSEDNITIGKRKIIKEGEIRFETANSQNTRTLIAKTVADIEGYISKDNVFDYDDRVEHRITIRVPANNFELLLDKISQNATKLDSKNINTLDVTEEFIDAEVRIKTKKELENRYKELLKQANKVDDLLAIEKEIGSLRTEIEAMEGRLNYLKDKVAFSTLTVVFYEKTSSAFGFNSKMGQAIQNGWTNLLWFFVTLTNLWPFILIGLIIVFIYRRYKNRNKKKDVI